MSSVDLPTPGSPPIKTRLPGTMPPPSTRFSSPHSSLVRGAFSAEICVKGTGWAGWSGFGLESRAAFLTWNSWSVFQARQCGHWPAHRRLSPPQSVQTKVMVGFAMGRLCTHDRAFDKGARTLLPVRDVVTGERQDAALTTPGAASLYPPVGGRLHLRRPHPRGGRRHRSRLPPHSPVRV